MSCCFRPRSAVGGGCQGVNILAELIEARRVRERQQALTRRGPWLTWTKFEQPRGHSVRSARRPPDRRDAVLAILLSAGGHAQRDRDEQKNPPQCGKDEHASLALSHRAPVLHTERRHVSAGRAGRLDDNRARAPIEPARIEHPGSQDDGPHLRMREPDAEQLLADRGIPEVWRRSVAEAVAVVDVLDQRLIPLERELRADPRVRLLVTIPGVGDLLGLTIASEIGDISRFASARKLVGYSGLTPRVYQSGQKARTGKLSRSGSTMLHWAAIEAAQQAWRPNNPWHQLYLDVKQRCAGKGNPAKAAVARRS